MKPYLTIALCLLISAASAEAHSAPKDCLQLRSEIASKLDAKGVLQYQLQIIDAAQTPAGQLVGSCNAGRQRIVYRRESSPASAKNPAPEHKS